MKTQIASDLHLEMVQRHCPGKLLVGASPEADLLVLAGDIGTATGDMRWG